MIKTMALLCCLLFFPFSVFSQWQRITGQIQGSISCFTSIGTKLFAGTADGRLYLSTNYGVDWDSINTGRDSLGSIHALTAVGANLVVSAFGHGWSGGEQVFVSPDDGKHWNTVWGMNGLNWSGFNCFYTIDSFLLAGSVGIQYSKDTGKYWKDIGNPYYSGGGPRSILVIDSSWFAGDYDKGVSRSTDNGRNWTWCLLGENDTFAPGQTRSLAAIGEVLFAGTIAPAIGNGPWHSGVFRSTDFGDHWTVVNKGLTDTNILCLLSSGTLLFAGSAHNTAFVSSDSGANWRALNEGFSAGDTGIFDMLTIEDYIFAITTTGQLYRRPLAQAGAILPQSNLSRLNSPHIISGSLSTRQVTVEYFLSSNAQTSLKIFDTRGKCISAPLGQRRPAGLQRHLLSTDAMRSGYYIIALYISNNFAESSTIVVR